MAHKSLKSFVNINKRPIEEKTKLFCMLSTLSTENRPQIVLQECDRLARNQLFKKYPLDYVEEYYIRGVIWFVFKEYPISWRETWTWSFQEN